MRRADTAIESHDEITAILQQTEVGYLGIVTAKGYPRVVPVNFVSESTTVYLHGALEGEKYELFKSSPLVTFHVNIAYSVIPSYWLARDHASGATQFFKSVQIDGRAELIENESEKARLLQLLMEKYQPEGGFRLISVSERMYQKPIRETAIVRVVPESVSARFKVGQQYPESTRRDLIARLRERNSGMDMLTAEEILKTLNR